MLSADDGSAALANISEGPSIGVWTVILPELLDRSEIVTRENQYKIKMADFFWWASALDKNMTLMVAVQLSQHLQSNRVVTSPWPTYVKNDYQVAILVSRFDGELGGEIVLRGLWNILDGDGEKKLDEQVFEFKTNTAEATYQALVEAMGQLTVQLAEQLVDGIINQESK
ncbi:MAG: hypothetical protein GQ538_11155 [Xanthomonadales bacterium]|nr:hypothetical protein [Xanthomonadales bacterium]